MDPNQQQLLLTAGGASEKTYAEEVFSTYVYDGNATARTITNGIDLAGEGGLVWTKSRTTATAQNLIDTVRGNTQRVRASSNGGSTNITDAISAFNNNGYGLAAETQGYGFNLNNVDYVSWTFRKAKGFFDIVTYTGTGSARTIAHSLGCIPGCIMVKRTDASANWAVYHRDLTDANRFLTLNADGDEVNNANYWDGTPPTSTHFSLRTDPDVNASGGEYVAYIFAGGASTAANAKSIVLNGSNQGLKTSSSSDYAFGTGDFTVEFWLKVDAIGSTMQTVDHRDPSGSTSGHWCNYIDNNGAYKFWMDGDRITGQKIAAGTWNHIATVRNSGVTSLYINGKRQGVTYADTNNYTNQRIIFGLHGPDESSFPVDGNYSNIRIVKGTAVYTSSFKPPTKPLTNITNTKFLAANSSTVTGTTVGTAVAINSPTTSTKSPFNDLDCFIFGEDGDQNMVKCGSYIGNNNSDGPITNLDWEPQWLLIKRAIGGSGEWRMFDDIRGLSGVGVNDSFLDANKNNAEVSNLNCIDISATNFEPKSSDTNWNAASSTYVYIAIRRPDPLVAKPAEAGTDVFTMDTGASQIPVFDSSVLVDFALMKTTNSTEPWYPGARLSQSKYLTIGSGSSGQDGQGSNVNWVFDYNDGWNNSTSHFNSSGYQSWMWKRHAGFDVVTYISPGGNNFVVNHSLGKVPEMMWIKNRGMSSNWTVYHKGLNGGTNPEDYGLHLNTNSAEVDDYGFFSDIAPTSTVFTAGYDGTTGTSGANYMAMLFASVTGISKVGSFSGSNSTVSVNLGFQPRFLILKRASGTGNWVVLDTVRGWGAGDDQYMRLNENGQNAGHDVGAPTSTGFDVTGGSSDYNSAGSTYIYYAHA